MKYLCERIGWHARKKKALEFRSQELNLAFHSAKYRCIYVCTVIKPEALYAAETLILMQCKDK